MIRTGQFLTYYLFIVHSDDTANTSTF